MFNFCLLMVPILLLWRQWGIAFGRWSNIIMVYYIWFSIGTNLWSIQDEYIIYIYFQFLVPRCYYLYITLFSIFGVWSFSVYGITYWNASHTYWRHFIYNMLILFNIQTYDYYPSDYKEDLFKRWFKRQKRYKFTKSLISHHFIFYVFFVEFACFYNIASPVDWYGLAKLLDNYFYIWILFVYATVLFRSLFVSNFFTGHMYYYTNNTFFEGISDWHYFINDSSYSTRLRKETTPIHKSGFRQVGFCYNSRIRMFSVKKYYLMDRNLEHGRFMIPISWVNFKYESYDFISTTRFYKIKNRFQDFWFRWVINLSYLRVVRLKKTYYVKKRRTYKSNFFLKKHLEKRKYNNV